MLVLTSTAGAWALDPSIDINTKLKSANTTLGLNNLWIIIGAVLVIFMQAGSRWWRPGSVGRSTRPT